MIFEYVFIPLCVCICIGLSIYVIRDIYKRIKIYNEVEKIINGCEEAVKQMEKEQLKKKNKRNINK